MNESPTPPLRIAAGLTAPLAALVSHCAAGRMIVLVDDVTRGGEGALILPADAVDETAITFMALRARGLVCLALTAEHALRLGLRLQPQRGDRRLDTSFTMSIEARHGVTTGISAADRAATIAVAMRPGADETSINSPGHVFPVVAAAGGVLERPGYAEAALDLVALAGRPAAAVFCRILREDGSMADATELAVLARQHGLSLGLMSDLVACRAESGTALRRAAPARIEPEATPVSTFADPAAGLKRAMRRLATTVAVITAAHDGKRGGFTATSICSLSVDPPSILACVSRTANTHPLIVASRRFCINLLTVRQRAVAEVFAGRGGQDGEEKFVSCGDWEAADFGLPVLKDSLAAIVCDLGDVLEVKTHSIFTGLVRRVACAEGAHPLIYADQGFTTLHGGELVAR